MEAYPAKTRDVKPITGITQCLNFQEGFLIEEATFSLGRHRGKFERLDHELFRYLFYISEKITRRRVRAPHPTSSSRYSGSQTRHLKWIREVWGLQLASTEVFLLLFATPPFPDEKHSWVCPLFQERSPHLRGRVRIPAGSGPASWRDPAGAGHRGCERSRQNAGWRAPRSNSRLYQLTSCAPLPPSPKAPSQ